MRNKKHIVKKPKFGRIWVVRFLVSFCIAVVICVIGTYIAVDFYRNYVAREDDVAFASAVNKVKDSYDDIFSGEDSEVKQASDGGFQELDKDIEGTDVLIPQENKMERFKTRIHWIYDTLAADNYSYAIYNADTRELLAEEEELSYIIFGVRETGEKSRIYRCPQNVMQDIFNYYDTLWEKADLEDGKRDGASAVILELNLVDVYLKDGTFVPGKMEIRQLEDELNDEDGETYTVIKSYDYTPEDTNGYTHIMVDRERYKILGPVWWGKGERCHDAKVLLKNFTENKEDLGSDLWKDETAFSRNIFGGIEYLDTETVTLGEKMSVKIVVATHYNLFEDYKVWVIAVYASVFAVAFLLSLAISYRTYMVQKNHYEMDAYRRETTNAMAHDLKTPLTAISGYAENLRDKVHTEKMDYYTEAILENVQYMNKMVGNILDLAKVENTEQKLNLETIHMKELTEEVLKKYGILIEERQLSVQIEGDSMIKADLSMMAQAVENLLGNAIKYSKAGTEVSIILTDACFEMRNVMETKPDISFEELWKPFVKGDNSRNSQRGSGIGLTIVKNIAEAHGYTFIVKGEEDVFMARISFKRGKR